MSTEKVKPKFVVIVRDGLVVGIYTFEGYADVPYLIIDEDAIQMQHDDEGENPGDDWTVEKEVIQRLSEDQDQFLHYVDGVVDSAKDLYESWQNLQNYAK